MDNCQPALLLPVSRPSRDAALRQAQDRPRPPEATLSPVEGRIDRALTEHRAEKTHHLYTAADSSARRLSA